MNYQIFACNVVLFLLALAFSFYLYRSMENNKAFARKTVDVLLVKTRKHTRKKMEKEEQVRIEDGKQEKESLFFRMDLLFTQSGLYKKFPFLNTELFFVIVLSTAAAGLFLLTNAFGLFVGIMAFTGICFLWYLILYLLSAANYNKTEKQIIRFVNLLGNYAQTTDDIITCMEKVSVSLEEPLKSAVIECCTEARTNADTEAAFSRLAMKIEHEEFQKIIHSIEVCSKHRANYAAVISRSKGTLKGYLASREKQKKKVSSARISILLILAVGIFCLKMMNGLAEEGIINFLQKTIFGKGLLLYGFFLLIFSFWQMISMGRKD